MFGLVGASHDALYCNYCKLIAFVLVFFAEARMNEKQLKWVAEAIEEMKYLSCRLFGGVPHEVQKIVTGGEKILGEHKAAEVAKSAVAAKN
jgi:hypothetical protein